MADIDLIANSQLLLQYNSEAHRCGLSHQVPQQLAMYPPTKLCGHAITYAYEEHIFTSSEAGSLRKYCSGVSL